MAGLLDVGLSGLISYRNAINVTANNLANLFNPDHSRQIVEFGERRSGLFGDGVEIRNVIRVSDQLALSDLRNSIAVFSRNDIYDSEISRLVNFMGQDSINIAKGIEDSFDALQAVLNDPTSIPARDVYINEIKGLSNRFKNVYDELDRHYKNVNANLDNLAQEASIIAGHLADVNDAISKSTQTGNLVLLDERDKLLAELSELVTIDTLEKTDGTVDVFLGSGNTLVLGSNASTIKTQVNAENPAKKDLILTDSFLTINITNQIVGGKLTGLLDYRREVLDPTLNSINLIAMGFADTMNEQNHLGMDLNGQLGGDIFQDINNGSFITNRIQGNVNNVGNITGTVTINDVSQLQASDYRLSFTSPTNYSIVRLKDNTSVATGVIGGFPHSVMADGFTTNITAGVFAANESYILSPLKSASKNINVAISDPRGLAIAAPIKTTSTTTNTGNGLISAGVVTDTTNASFTTTPGQLTPPIRVEFLSPTSYQLVNATTSAIIEGPIVFTPGQNNAVFPTPGTFDPGYQIDISGAPATGDSFTINYNTNGFGDNRNGILLDKLNDVSILENNSISFQDSFIQTSGIVSSTARFVGITKDATQTLMEAAQAKKDSISGVNEEEEAANLLNFQRAFQAMAQVMTVTDSLIAEMLGLVQ